MKLRGERIEGLNIETIVIPRGDNPPIIFKAQALPNFEEFDAICPMPKGRTILRKDGTKETDTKDKSYQKSIEEYGKRRVAYMVVKALEATPELEWETIDIDNPDTWENYRQEFKDAGLSEPEQVRIIQGVMSANGLNEAKVEAARQDFLAGKWESKESHNSQKDEQLNTQSSELVNDLDKTA